MRELGSQMTGCRTAFCSYARKRWNVATQGELAGTYIFEVDQVNVCAAAVLGRLEEVDHAFEPRSPRQLPGDIADTDLPDRFHDYLPIFHPVDAADLHARTVPDADRTGDRTLADSLPKMPGADHGRLIPAQ